VSDYALCLTIAPEATTLGADGKGAGFRGIAYSGGVVPNFGLVGDMAIDLASLTVPDTPIPVLRQHDHTKIVGRARLINDGRQLQIVDGTFSAATEAGRETAALMAEGHPWQLSVGIGAPRYENANPKKPTAVNGRSLAVEAVMRRGRVLELSFVPSGADPNAIAAQLASNHGIKPATQPPPKAGANMDDPNPLQARVDELTAQLSAVTLQREEALTALAAANTALTAAATARRKERMSALFGEDDAALTAEQRTGFESMTDAQFAAVESSLTAARGAGDSTLFQQQAKGGRNHEAGGGQATFSAPAGIPVDEERAQLHAKALKYQADHAGTDYLTAVTAVSH
jgi:hypothetical protein